MTCRPRCPVTALLALAAGAVLGAVAWVGVRVVFEWVHGHSSARVDAALEETRRC